MSNAKSVDRELSPEKTEAILQGAMQEFLEHGYAGARIDKIVVAAGVSKATVYRHFADKEALFNALIQRLAARANLFQQPSFPSWQEHEDPIAFLHQYAAETLATVDRNPQGLVLFRIILGESGRFPDLAQAFVQTIEKPGIEFLMQYFKEHPQLQFDDPEVAARVYVGTIIHFMVVQNLLHGDDIMPMQRDRLINGLLNLLIDNQQRS